MKAIGYCWAEVGDDGAEMNSGMQHLMVEAFIKKRKFPQRGIYFEDLSESVTPFDERQTGQEIDRLLRKGDALVIPAQDCLFRTAADGVSLFQKFRKRGIHVYSLDLNTDIIFGPQAELIQMVLQPLARSESSLLSDRVKKQKQAKKAENHYLGGKVPFGFKVDKAGKLIADQKQQVAIKRMQTLMAEGLSLRAIANEMKRRGVLISHTGVKTIMLSNKRR